MTTIYCWPLILRYLCKMNIRFMFRFDSKLPPNAKMPDVKYPKSKCRTVYINPNSHYYSVVTYMTCIGIATVLVTTIVDLYCDYLHSCSLQTFIFQLWKMVLREKIKFGLWYEIMTRKTLTNWHWGLELAWLVSLPILSPLRWTSAMLFRFDALWMRKSLASCVRDKFPNSRMVCGVEKSRDLEQYYRRWHAFTRETFTSV